MAAQEREDDAEPNRGGAADGARAGGTGPGGATPSGPAEGTPPAGDQADTARVQPPVGPGPGPGAPPPAGPDATSVLPPTPGGGRPAPEAPRWAARAQVPTPRVQEYGDEWVTEPPRSLFMPILVTVCVMLLLGVLGAGLWLLLSDRPGPEPSPSPSPTTAPVTSPTTGPTTTTTSASPTPTQVLVPPTLIDQEYEVAAEELRRIGLVPVREDVVNDDFEAGRVIGTNPTAGSPVAPGAEIIVFVSTGPEPTGSPSPSPSASPTTTGT